MDAVTAVRKADQYMRAAMLSAPGQVEVSELARPVLAEDEVLVRVQAVGICQSDIEMYQGKWPEEYCRYPVVPGAQWSGTVEAVGAAVRTISNGSRVVAESRIFCGHCQNCVRGQTQLCEAPYAELGFTRPGGLAEYVAVPERLLHLLDTSVPFDEAALIAPVAGIVQVLQRVQPRPGYVIAIIGASLSSLVALQLFRLYSPASSIVLAFREEQLALARQMGATHTAKLGREEPREIVRQFSGGRGADLVFEGEGDPQAMSEALRLARPGGSVILEGIAGSNALLNIEADTFALRALTVYGVSAAGRSAWNDALRLAQQGVLQLAPLIERRIGLEDYPDTLEELVGQQARGRRILVTHDV